MSILTEQTIRDATADLARHIRSGGEMADQVIADIADNYAMLPSTLRERFYRAYPDGLVPSALPTVTEARLQKSRSLAKEEIQKFEPYAEIDGREVLLDGKLHTLITVSKPKKVLIAFSHDDLAVVEIRLDAWSAMKKALP